jgi:hypothetical protein
MAMRLLDIEGSQSAMTIFLTVWRSANIEASHREI